MYTRIFLELSIKPKCILAWQFSPCPKERFAARYGASFSPPLHFLHLIQQTFFQKVHVRKKKCMRNFLASWIPCSEKFPLPNCSVRLRLSLWKLKQFAHDSVDTNPSAKADPLRRRRIIWLRFRSGGVSGAAPLDDGARCANIWCIDIVKGISLATALVPKKVRASKSYCGEKYFHRLTCTLH